MAITVYNTLTRTRAPLAPREPGHVRVYVCGVTVYDFCHMGNGRTLVAFDVVVRWLRARGYRVTYVRNVTDVDDKIIQRAAERGITPSELAVEFTRHMQDDLAALGCITPDHEPRATEFIPQMLDIIELLERKDLAYQAGDGDVDYAVRRFPRYGRLSGKSLDDLRAGERVAVGSSKRDMVVKALRDSSIRQSVAEMLVQDGLGKTAERVQYVELATDPDFQRQYVAAMQFDPIPSIPEDQTGE